MLGLDPGGEGAEKSEEQPHALQKSPDNPPSTGTHNLQLTESLSPLVQLRQSGARPPDQLG